MRRVSVVGNSGSGKSTLAARLARALDAPHVELDAVFHQPGWTPLDLHEFLAAASRLSAGERWVIDGNYREVTMEGPVWARADAVVWLRLPRRTVMRQIVGRTLRRTLTRQPLWNDNREPLSGLWRWDPERNIMRWAWTRHAKYEARYTAAQQDPRYGHLEFVTLRSHDEVEAWLAGLSGPA
ncbi:MAG: adenylate kinase [Acidimicrobiales bacterium]